MLKKNFIVIAILIAFINCSDDGETVFPPEVFTGEAIVGSNGGVTISGSIESNGTVIESYGVEYSENDVFGRIENREVRDGFQSNFSFFFSNNLELDQRYFYRTFSRSDKNEVFYGETKSFISRGYATPVIESLSGDLFYHGDEVTMRGKYFTTDFRGSRIFIDGKSAVSVSLSDSIIQFTVPNTLEKAQNELRLNVADKEVIYSSTLNIYTPVINSISPLGGTFEDEITIIGNHFGRDISENKVFFVKENSTIVTDVVEAELISANRTEIRVKVPLNLKGGRNNIRVIAQGQAITFGDIFELDKPVIQDITPEAQTKDVIEIKGQFFHPTLNENKVLIEGIEAEIVSGDTNKLNVRVPQGPFPKRDALVQVQVLDLITEFGNRLKITDDWVMVNNSLPFRFNRSIRNPVVIGDDVFILSYDQNVSDENVYLWKFNENDFSWAKHTIPFEMKSSGVAVGSNGKMFVYTANANNEFWEYEPNSNSWTKKSDYAGNRRDNATFFSINADIYIGMGVDDEPYMSVPFGDFYKYDTNNNSWTRVADFSFQNYFERRTTSAFVINNIAYLGNGASNTGMVDFWSYNPSTNQWSRLADFPDARNGTSSFVLNNFGYVTGGTPIGSGNYNDNWRYNPASNTWEMAESIVIERAGHFSFVLNGKAYIGGGGIGNSGGSSGYDLFQFIP